MQVPILVQSYSDEGSKGALLFLFHVYGPSDFFISEPYVNRMFPFHLIPFDGSRNLINLLRFVKDFGAKKEDPPGACQRGLFDLRFYCVRFNSYCSG